MTGTLKVVAWPYRGGRNPYTHLLYDTMREIEDGLEVDDFEVMSLSGADADVLHLHWPESCVESASAVRAATKTLVFLLRVAILRAQGTRIVWTVHNLQSHERGHPLLERLLRALLHRMLDGVVHLSAASAAAGHVALPRLRDVPAFVVPHGDYRPLTPHPPDRTTARTRTGQPQDATLLAFVGAIRPYKDVVGLVGAVRRLRGSGDDVRLVVAGSADDEALAAEVADAADADDGIDLRLGWSPHEALVDVVRASDAVVLPYRDFNNSGVVVLALSLGRPAVVPRTPAMEELATLVGPRWLLMLDGPFDEAAAAAAVRTLREDPPRGSPDLRQLAWPVVARQTLDVYDAVIAASGRRRTAR